MYEHSNCYQEPDARASEYLDSHLANQALLMLRYGMGVTSVFRTVFVWLGVGIGAFWAFSFLGLASVGTVERRAGVSSVRLRRQGGISPTRLEDDLLYQREQNRDDDRCLKRLAKELEQVQE